MKKRFVSIDIFRGFDIAFMIFLHMSIWGRKFGSSIIFDTIINLIDGIGAEGFVFISGLSLSLSFHSSMKKIQSKDTLEYKQYRLIHFVRAFLIFILGFLVYNLTLAITWGGFQYLWVWNIFQTLAFCMFLIWPLMNVKKIYKIIVGIIFLFLHQFLYIVLNQNGVIYYILYNGFLFSPILGYFPFFIFGTLVADIIYEKEVNEKTRVSDKKFIKTVTIPFLIVGGLIMIVLFSLFPTFVFKGNLIGWLIYSCGAQFIVFNILFIVEKLEIFNFKKNYRFFFYFSYYSLSVFLLHSVIFSYLIGLLSYESFVFKYFISYFIIIIIFYLFLRYIYKKYGKKFALKHQISRLASYLVKKYYESQESKVEIEVN
jgi:hypothetical protein